MSPHWWFRSPESNDRAFSRRWFRSPTCRTPRGSVSRQPQGRRPLLEAFEDRVLPTFSLGAASNYAILFEGGGSNNSLQVTNVTTNVTGTGPGQGGGIGNIGVGNAGKVSRRWPWSTINGNLDFSASNTGQFTSAMAST